MPPAPQQIKIPTRHQPSPSGEVPFDFLTHRAVGSAPFDNRALGTINDFRNIAMASTDGFTVERYEGVAQLPPFNEAGAVVDRVRSLVHQQLSEDGKV